MRYILAANRYFYCYCALSLVVGRKKTETSPCWARCTHMCHPVWINSINRQLLHWQMGRDGAQYIKRLYRSSFNDLFDYRHRGSFL